MTLRKMALMKFYRSFLTNDEMHTYERYRLANKILSGTFFCIVPIAICSHIFVPTDVPHYYKFARKVFFGIGVFGFIVTTVGHN